MRGFSLKPLPQALAEAAGQVWLVQMGAAAELAYAAAQVCLEKQDLANVQLSSSLEEPVMFTKVRRCGPDAACQLRPLPACGRTRITRAL